MKIDIEEIEAVYETLAKGDNDRLATPIKLLVDVMKLASKHGAKRIKNAHLLHIACKVIEVLAEEDKQERVK